MRDLGATLMRPVDIVVIDSVLREMAGETLAVTGFGRVRKLIQQTRKFVASHLASRIVCGSLGASLSPTIAHPGAPGASEASEPGSSSLFGGFGHRGRHSGQPSLDELLEPGALTGVMHRAIGEMVVAGPRTWQPQAGMSARGPAMHHRIGHVGMKLQAECVIELKRFDRKIAALGQQFGAR